MQKSLAQKVDWLFDVRRGTQGRPFTYGQIQRGSGNRITASYVWKLRTGAMSNPGLSALQALADFFEVPLDYFGSAGEYLEGSIRLSQALPDSASARQELVQRVTAQADDLSDDGLRAAAQVIEYWRAHDAKTRAANGHQQSDVPAEHAGSRA